MPRDRRLWMTFPIDMHRHPKITRLPMSARWAFFEMNGEARIEQNDGVFSKADAEFRWSHEVLAQLVNSHPTTPLVVQDGDTCRIRQYARYQQTRAQKHQRAHIPNHVRRAVMLRDGGQCVFCSATDRLQLDHIIRYRDGGPDTVDNLRVLCKPCNTRRR